MFLRKYLDETKYKLVFEHYSDAYLYYGLDKTNFEEIYSLFEKYKFHKIDDIIVNHLEIFQMDFDEVEEKVLKLKCELGDQFVEIIEKNNKYLDRILED